MKTYLKRPSWLETMHFSYIFSIDFKSSHMNWYLPHVHRSMELVSNPCSLIIVKQPES